MTTHDWRDQAACAGTYPEAWFVETGDYPSGLFRICAACPVREECLESALAEEGDIRGAGRFGIRGGHTPRERARIARQRRKEAEAA